jgi:hypothetical protein
MQDVDSSRNQTTDGFGHNLIQVPRTLTAAEDQDHRLISRKSPVVSRLITKGTPVQMSNRRTQRQPYVSSMRKDALVDDSNVRREAGA